MSFRKVLFIHDGPLFKDERGNYYGIHLKDELKQRYLYLGDSVTFLIRVKDIKSEDAGKYSLITPENFSVIPVPDFKSFSKYFTIRPKAKAIIKEAVENHDIIVTRLPSASGNIAVGFAREMKKPLLAEMVACTLDAYWYHSFKGKLIAHYSYLKQRRIMKDLEYCIYVTKYFLQSRYPIAGKSINCSNVEISDPHEEILAKRINKIASGKDSNILSIGSIGTLNIPYKGHDDVLKALAVLKKRGINNIVYYLVGQGDISRLEEIISRLGITGQVKILGTMKHADIFPFIDTLDIYVHPSRTEGLPRAPIEAMSRACPVIGSDAGGTTELISKEFTFAAGNVGQLVELLTKNNNSETLTIEAKRNFELSKDYRKSILDERRKDFYDLFLKEKIKQTI